MPRQSFRKKVNSENVFRARAPANEVAKPMSVPTTNLKNLLVVERSAAEPGEQRKQRLFKFLLNYQIEIRISAFRDSQLPAGVCFLDPSFLGCDASRLSIGRFSPNYHKFVRLTGLGVHNLSKSGTCNRDVEGRGEPIPQKICQAQGF